ncbi:MAG TPA: DEAD/DEAH box helicase, partial [Wenzhouxiangella sp.]
MTQTSNPSRRAISGGAKGPATQARNERGGGARPYHRLLYRLCLSADGSQLSVCPTRAPLAGIIGAPAPFSPQRLINDEAKERASTWITDADRTLLHGLADRSAGLPGLVWFPLGLSSGEFIRSMIECKRAVLCLAGVDEADEASKAGIKLSLGEPIEASPHWQLNNDGSQTLIWSPNIEVEPKQDKDEPAQWISFPLSPPWLIDSASGVCHPVEVSASVTQALDYLGGEPLRPSQVEDWQAQSFAKALPMPRSIVRTEKRLYSPTPVAKLHNITVGRMGRFVTLPAVSLMFDYGVRSLVWNTDRATVLAPDQDDGCAAQALKIWAIDRDLTMEQAATDRLRALGLAPLGELEGVDYPAEHQAVWVVSDFSSDERVWLNVQTTMTQLGAESWRVAQSSQLTLALVKPKRWYGELKNAEGEQFDLDLGVQIDGESVSMLPALMNYVEQATAADLKKLLGTKENKRSKNQTTLILPLDAQRRVEVPIWRIRAALTGLLDLLERSPGATQTLDLKRWRLRLPKSRLSDIGQAADGWTLRGDRDLTDLAKQLQSFEKIEPMAAPVALQATLRGYQQAGLAWLQFLRSFGFGGILADDMGLGKTIQTLAHLLIEKEQKRAKKPTLVIAPTSLMFNWRREAERFAPDLKVCLWHGTHRKKLRRQLTQADLVLTSYPLIARDIKLLSGLQWHLLVLDEAQAIKNPRAAVSTAVRQLKANHRLCLTGTPLENHLGELWSLFDFLMPGLLGTREQFRRWFRQPIEKGRDHDRQALLASRIRPFFLRRTKAEVTPELPDKTQIIRSVPLGAQQRRLYESQRIQLHDKVRYALQTHGPERGRMVMLDALLKLRQICCDPRLLKDDSHKAAPSAKLELLMDLLPELIADGRRVLLFSQFVGMLDLIEPEVKALGIDYVRLTGQTKDREEVVERFQRSEAPLFLISLKAGGVGLNLTAADVVIHYDPWWNPAVEDQATDRAHRIGQDHKVFV